MDKGDIYALLLGCLGQDRARFDHAVLQRLTSADWEFLLAEAGQQRVSPLLYHRLQTLGAIEQVPADVQQRLKTAYQQTARGNLRAYGELHQLAAALRERQIPIIVLKGAYLIDAVYHNIAVRPMRDIDLLAPQARIDDVIACFVGMGYAPAHFYESDVAVAVGRHIPIYVKEGRAGFELHWTITQPGQSWSIDVEELWQRAVPVKLAGSDVLRLSAEDLLLHLCLHVSYQHQFAFGLRPFCDLAETIHHFGQALDWESIIERSQRWGWERGVYMALLLAQDMLAAAVPNAVLARLRPGDFDETLAVTARTQVFTEHIFTGSMSQTYSQMWGGDGFRQRLRLAGGSLFPSRQIMSLNYPVAHDSPKVFLYYPVRAKDLARRYAGMTWRLLRGDEETSSLAERSLKLQQWLQREP